jgi:hypothetical protein
MRQAADLQSYDESSAVSKVSETVEMILEAHFERFTKPNVDALISAWSKNEGGLKKAILFFYRVANDPKEKFQTFLMSEFQGRYEDLQDEGLRASYKVLDVISNQCNGNLKEHSDPILRHCRVVSSLPEEELEPQIGRYFKDALKGYLRENFSSLYEEVRNELSFASEGVAANDLMPSSSVSLLGASKLQGEAAKEDAREDGSAFGTEKKKGGGGRS